MLLSVQEGERVAKLSLFLPPKFLDPDWPFPRNLKKACLDQLKDASNVQVTSDNLDQHVFIPNYAILYSTWQRIMEHPGLNTYLVFI